MNSIRKSIIVCSMFLVCMAFSMTTVFANSAQTRWTGTDSTGTIVLDEDSPIIVEKELLTFDIQEFPQSYYHDANAFLAYSAKVTAEYTFYNPSDYHVSATLAFPFGGTADYAYIEDTVDTDKYDITIDGEVIDKQIRHTLLYYGDQFELEKDLARLHDGYMEDAFYYPDQLVTKYTYKVSDVDLETYKAATPAISITEDTNRKYYMVNQSGYTTRPDEVLMSTWIEEDGLLTVYVIGEALEKAPEWKFYENGGCKEEIDGKAEVVEVHWMYLKDFVLSEFKEEYGVLDYDWYNAIVTMLKYNEASNGAIHGFDVYFDLRGILMRWYQYEIALEPNERIVNTVTAPIYPSINSDYNPAIYKYTYLLSPAKTWKEFGNLDIVVNTPYYMIESETEGFEYNNPGYTLHLTGLPEGELVFTLCKEAKSIAPTYNNPIIPFVIGGVIVFVICGILLLKKKV